MYNVFLITHATGKTYTAKNVSKERADVIVQELSDYFATRPDMAATVQAYGSEPSNNVTKEV